MIKHPLKLSLVTMLLIAGCTTTPDKPTEVNEALDKAYAENVRQNIKPLTYVPNAVQNELMQQNIQTAKNQMLAEKRFDVAARGVLAQDFFSALVKGTKYNIVMHPDVKGRITIDLRDVTLIEALKVIEDMYGYGIEKSDRVVQVFPADVRTETIPLNYLFLKRFGLSTTTVNSGGVSENDPNSGGNNSGNNGNYNNNNNNNYGNNNSSNGGNNQNNPSGTNIYTENESDFWKELKETLTEIMGNEEGRSVIVSPQAGLVTVRGLPQEIRAVKKFISDTQEQLRRQVIIEAKIMEVTLNDDYQQGINWSNVIASAGDTDFTFDTTGNIVNNVISTAIGGTTSFGVSNPDFTAVIDLLQTQGNVQVLSSPRITASNNQKAVIKVGEDEYFVTEVSSTTTTGTATTTTPEIELTPFFSGIALDVTPQIDHNGEVILHVHPSVTVTDEQTKTIKIAEDEYVLPLAQSNVRESDTIIKAKSGEIVVIGGLIETKKTDIESKTPLLGDIPFLGELFKSKAESIQKKELVILLKPIVVGQDTWQHQIKDAREMLKKWFPEDDDSDDEEGE
ncbi:pilus (MSHA type) biogenesis protein MshL [Thalassotalea agarivorans]|uniref:MSHA biogenesis protein MshL n=1 Tax=Thalassotalea agarivorans TaxID=349064 RepID=A0A1I0G103_THASX|nr:pilus (MSHA type) biogenesis protein MshL [Thalassotalea agarivorans]SET64257.1 MSHA biogenesis protein MshL [Thalassotalea agarivorans]